MAREFNFFSTINDFIEVVPGVDASTQLEEMQAAYERAKKTIIDAIGQAQWDVLLAEYGTAADPIIASGVAQIQGALGNRTYYNYLIFKVSGKKKEQISFFKYEIRAMQETYLDNYWVYMDTLLTLFTANPAKFPGWVTTDMSKTLVDLFVKTAYEFSKYCGLDESAYFFNRTIHLQLEVTDTDIASRQIEAATYAGKPKLERNIKRAICYKTTALALMQFDYPDVPKSLRADIFNEFSKEKGAQEKHLKQKVAGMFFAKADTYLELIDYELNQPDQDAGESPDIYIPTLDVNEPGDKHFLMS